MPPQLQLVCGALFHRARQAGRKTLTVADYEALGGAQGVLRGYLDDELRRFPPEEQALARDLLEELVTSERTKKVETLAELATALAAEPDVLSEVVEKLVRAWLLRPVERGDTAERAYELAHEYLIAEIALSAEAVARKEAEELLRQGMDTWHRFDALLSAEAFELIDAQRERLRLDAGAQELMLRSALRHGRSVGYWLAQVEDEKHALALGEEILLVPEGERASQRLGAEVDDLKLEWLRGLLDLLARAWCKAKGDVQTRASALALVEESLLTLEGEHLRRILNSEANDLDLTPEQLRALSDLLAKAWCKATGDTRVYASNVLWMLRSHLPRPLWLRLALSRLPRLMAGVALPVAGGVFAFLSLISLATWGRSLWYPRPEIEMVEVEVVDA